MESVVTTFGKFARSFADNLQEEVRHSVVLQHNLSNAKYHSKYLLESIEPLSTRINHAFRKCTEHCRLNKWKPGAPSTNNTANGTDLWLKKTFGIPQYYGGIWDEDTINRMQNKYIRKPPAPQGLPTQTGKAPQLQSITDRLQTPAWYTKLYDSIMPYRLSRLLNDYTILNSIENVLIPQIMADLFAFKPIRHASDEAASTLKKFRNSLIEPRGLHDISLVLTDLRRTAISKIHIKNYKKSIQTTFEFSATIAGKRHGKQEFLEKHFSCRIEFNKNGDGLWVASSASCDAL